METQQAAAEAAQHSVNQNTQTSKDDIVRLIHLFKEPSAQRHWTNLHGIMRRGELDNRKAPLAYAEASNPLCLLAELLL